MAITSSNSPFYVLLDAGRTILHQKLGEMKKAQARRNRFHETYAELMAMSDRNLKDLGISRSEIQRLAMEAANDI